MSDSSRALDLAERACRGAEGDEADALVQSQWSGFARFADSVVHQPTLIVDESVTAAAPTHRFYVMYNRDKEGHVASIDLLSGQVVWDRVLHTPGVDRGNLTPDGTTLYLQLGKATRRRRTSWR